MRLVLEDAVSGRERVEQSLGHPYCIARGPQVIDQNQELIATEAAHEVGTHFNHARVPDAQRSSQTPGNLTQQLIPGLVAQCVIDDLETIEIKEQHRAACLLPAPNP